MLGLTLYSIHAPIILCLLSRSSRVYGDDLFLLENTGDHIQGGPKKSLWCYLEEKYFRNSKIFFDWVVLLLKKLELSKLCRKKVTGL